MARKLLIGVATTDWSRTFSDPRGGMALGGSGWIRFGQLVNKSKHRIVIGKMIKSGKRIGISSWDSSSTANCDVIIMQRHMEKWVPDVVRNAVAAGQIVINDVDDWYWNMHPENTASKVIDPKHQRHSNVDFYSQTISESSHITVSTPFLEEAMKSYGKPVQLIQNGVSTVDYSARRQSRQTPVLGWAGSTAHRSGDLEIIRGFADKIKAHRWHHLGHNDLHPSFAERTGIAEGLVSTTQMLPPWEYSRAFAFDIGTVPLSDHEFNNAKSWIKGLEYIAAGIPFIASPSPEYLRLYEEYGIGRIACTPQEWVENIKSMSDAKHREREAEEALKIVSAELDAYNQAKALDAFVNSIT